MFSPATATPESTTPEARTDAFVDAARALADETGDASFTVARVVERAGQSLKAFYARFDGKDDLLLALLAHDSRRGATLLAAALDDHTDPLVRLRTYLHQIVTMATDPANRGYAGVLSREHRRLAASHADQMRAALAPLVDLLETEIAAAADAGVVDPLDPVTDAETIAGLVMAAIADLIAGHGVRDAAEHAEYLWRFCRRALGGDGDREEPRWR